MEKTTHTDGSITFYTYDYKGRKTREEKVAPGGGSLCLYQWHYNAHHLISEIDPEGYKTEYSYDPAGRLTMTNKGNSETRYRYDTMGRQSEIWEKYELEKYRITAYEYDHLDRVISEAIKNENGALLTRKSYVYDVDSNRTETIIHDDQGTLSTKVQYNPERKPIKVTQPNGTESFTIYHYDYTNDLGHHVAAYEEIDPKGNRCLRVMDTCGHIAKEERRDALGKLLQRNIQTHDGEGNLIRRTDEVIIDGEVQKQVQIKYQYDSRNRSIVIIEAVGDPLEKVTRKEYNARGELTKLIKPDGVALLNEYDYLGRLTELRSSDGTIHYQFTHDLRNNIVKVNDLVLNITTHRTFDADNWLMCEELGNLIKIPISK